MIANFLVTAILLAGAEAQHQDAAALVTEGKLDADLGDFACAALSFQTVADDEQAPTELRWEALVRLGQMRARLGEREASVEAFRRVVRLYSSDSAAIRFLALAVGGVVPGPPRWEEVRRDLTLHIENAAGPTPSVRWPGFDSADRREYDGPTVSLHVDDASIADVVRELSVKEGFSYAIYAGAKGRVSASFENTPWDRVLHLVTEASGLETEQVDHVQIIADAAALGRLRDPGEVPSSGDPVSIDYEDGDLLDAVRLLADVSELNFVLLPGVSGRVSLALRKEPWKRALFFLLDSQGLGFTQRDRVVVIAEPARLRPYQEMETRPYRGKIVSIDFRNADFGEVTRFFEKASGLPVVADRKPEGNLDFKLVEVPWDQALDLIVTLDGLHLDMRDQAIRIGGPNPAPAAKR
jgi:hypothetical protein